MAYIKTHEESPTYAQREGLRVDNDDDSSVALMVASTMSTNVTDSSCIVLFGRSNGH